MKYLSLIILGALLIGIIVTTGGCANSYEAGYNEGYKAGLEKAAEDKLPKTTHSSPTPTHSATFNRIVLTGSGDKNTPPFEVTTDEWIIDWSYDTDSKYPGFSFFVYPRGETTSYVERISDGDEETNGTTYIYADPGEYYIKVLAANLRSWKITIRPA